MVVVEVCGDLTLLSAGGSLLVYDHSSAKSRVINVFTENNNNNNNNSTKTEEDEEEEEEGGGGGVDNINGIKEETGSRDGTEGRKENDNKELKKKKKKKNEKSDEEEKKHDNSDTGNQSITAAKFSPCGRWLVVGGGWKAVEVWRVADWVRLASHTLPKRPTALAVTADSSCVLVADRAGDVYKFPLSNTTTTTTATPPKPLLGHLSMLLDVAITPDRRYIVTCDRDEKVRLTHLAHTCLIHTFLLGHLEFVTCLAVISADPPRLLSCSGDGTIKLWDYEEGVCLSTLDLSPHVSPLPLPAPSLSMVTRGGKRKPEGEEGEGSSTPPLPPTPPAAATAVKKVAVISSSSSYLVAALVYRAWEVVLCRVEDTHLHVISTTALKGEPLGGAWRRRARRRRKRTEEAEEGGGGGGGEELILVVKDASGGRGGGGGGGGVVVMEVVKDKLVEVEEEEEEKKEEEEEEERSTTIGRRYDHLVQGLSTPLDSNGIELALLYKQKYDNVGEYMKKKKEREKLAEEGVRLTKRGRWAR